MPGPVFIQTPHVVADAAAPVVGEELLLGVDALVNPPFGWDGSD